MQVCNYSDRVQVFSEVFIVQLRVFIESSPGILYLAKRGLILFAFQLFNWPIG